MKFTGVAEKFTGVDFERVAKVLYRASIGFLGRCFGWMAA
jgi:hypothetical protein